MYVFANPFQIGSNTFHNQKKRVRMGTHLGKSPLNARNMNLAPALVLVSRPRRRPRKLGALRWAVGGKGRALKLRAPG